MEAVKLTKTGPARRVSRGRLFDGYIELTPEYIGFRPLSGDAEIGFLQWVEFKSVRVKKKTFLLPESIQVSRTGGNLPLVLCVQDTDAWVALITAAHEAYVARNTAKPMFSVSSNKPFETP